MLLFIDFLWILNKVKGVELFYKTYAKKSLLPQFF